MNITIEFLHIRISLGTKFQLKLTILIFSTKIAQKGYFQLKTEKGYTTIKFCIIKLVRVPSLTLNFDSLSQIAQKGYFWSKTKKLNTNIEFCKLKLVSVPNFSVNWQFWIFGVNSPSEGISGLKQKVNTTTRFCIFVLV